VAELNVEALPKRLELLHELLPTAKVMALLVNPTSPTAETQSREVQALAGTIGLRLHILHASTDRDLDTVFASLVELRVEGLVIGSGHTFFANRVKQLAALTVRYELPAIHQTPEFVAAGGLMSYGTSITDAYRQAGIYTGRILEGEKPADLPIQQATKVELILNMKTAKVRGITVPPILLERADEVIE
jgi:putative ABC transport system substrate-binding protein